MKLVKLCFAFLILVCLIGPRAFAAEPEHVCPASCQAARFTLIGKRLVRVHPHVPTGTPGFGTTVQTVHSAFPSVMLYNWSHTANPNALLLAMPDVTVARLSRQYYLETNGAMLPLLEVFAKRLDAANLIRLRTAFGRAITDLAVAEFAPPAVAEAYRAQLTTAAANRIMPRSEANYAEVSAAAVGRGEAVSPLGAPIAAPTLDMTLYEVFLDYYTIGDATAIGALAETASFASGYLSGSFTVGYSIGSAIYWIDDELDPDINIAIGNEIGGTVDDVVNYAAAETATDPWLSYDDGSLDESDYSVSEQ